MEYDGQSIDIPVDSQNTLVGSFDLLTYINEFSGEENAGLDQAILFPEDGQTIQVLANSIDVETTQVMQSNQLTNVEDDKDALYDTKFELAVEPLTIPEVDFHVRIAETGRNELYTQSNQLNKIFTSIDKPCTFQLSLNSSSTTQPIVRVMLVCTNALYQPLSRCAHHAKSDSTEQKNHVVIRKDGPAEYIGIPEGESFRDRLALKIPLGNSHHKSIILEFKCLSSCHKIKKVSTALVFTLEDPASGQLLGREIVPIQVSKNFRRDMETAEKATLKRTSEPIQKRKQPSSSDPAAESSSQAGQFLNEEPVSVDLNLNLPHHSTSDFLKYVEQFFAAKLYGADESTEQQLMPALKKIRQQRGNRATTRKLWTKKRIKRKSQLKTLHWRMHWKKLTSMSVRLQRQRIPAAIPLSLRRDRTESTSSCAYPTDKWRRKSWTKQSKCCNNQQTKQQILKKGSRHCSASSLSAGITLISLRLANPVYELANERGREANLSMEYGILRNVITHPISLNNSLRY